MSIVEVIVDISNSSVDRVFDYEADDNILVGMRVVVPFGNRKIYGFVIAKKDVSTAKNLKKVISFVEDYVCLTSEMISLMHFMTKKYHLRKIDCLNLFMPAQLRSQTVRPLIIKKCKLNDELDFDEYKQKIKKNAKLQLELSSFLETGVVYNKTEIVNKFSLPCVNKFIADNVLVEFSENLLREPSFNKVEYVKRNHTPLQKRAITEILNKNTTHLLFGVTGSGKTEVYMSVIEKVLEKGKTAIMLVPEISLTPQVLGSFKSRFNQDVAILHSGLSAGERLDEWSRILFKKAKIVIGARSAIFAPIENVGVVIIDEEHEGSYISETNPRYNTFDIADFRRKFNDCTLILASATPNIASYSKALSGEYNLIELPERVNGRDMPKIEVVDMLNEIRNGNTDMFSASLIDKLDKCMEQKHQAMIFINRRGFSSFMRCTDCGFVAKCTDCDVSLVYHKSENSLKCHYCGKRYKALTHCKECGSTAIRNGAVGTEQVVAKLKEMYPNVKVLRMDNDTTRTKNAYQKILNEFGSSKPAILVGTQMIAKGHDFKDVTLVGIVDADQSLYHTDFKSCEKTFELITQMSGRAGRDEAEGVVVLQTYNPKHYAYRFIANYDYKNFFEKEINLRQVTGFPPFTRIVRVLFSSENEEMLKEIVKLCYNDVRSLSSVNEGFVYLDAMKCPLGRIKNKIRYQILCRINENIADEMQDKIYKIVDKYMNTKVNCFVEINPQSLS